MIELLVTIAIIAILSSIGVVMARDMTKKAKIAAMKANLSSIYSAEKIFHAEFGSYSTRLDAIGYSANGEFDTNVGFMQEYSPPLPAKQGTPGCQATCGLYGVNNCPNMTWRCTANALSTNFGHITVPPTASTNWFIAEGHFHYESLGGGLHKYVTVDINQDKIFRHMEGIH